MARDSMALTAETMHFVNGEGPVLYASLPCGPWGDQSLESRQTNLENQKHRLASGLWDQLAEINNSHWTGRLSHNSAVFPVRLVRGLLGRPHLLSGENLGPAISFSQCGGNVWAALCADNFNIGMDAAQSDEFQGEYPFYRVFQPQEIAHALKLTEKDMGKASALLWSIKEAFAKALGCGFHFVDPRQIEVYPSDQSKNQDGAFAFPVGLSKKAEKRFPMAVGRYLWVRSLSKGKGKMWISIALLNWQDRISQRAKAYYSLPDKDFGFVIGRG